jgi:hypothetical protein
MVNMENQETLAERLTDTNQVPARKHLLRAVSVIPKKAPFKHEIHDNRFSTIRANIWTTN